MPAKNSMDSSNRFTGRQESYLRYRPGYPSALVDALVSDCGLEPGWIIADIGAGTGFLTELFLAHGNDVYGVEPNAAMRTVAAHYLSRYPAFHSVAGSAEDTTLASASVEFVSAGQAFHWFEPETTRTEFTRILRPGGWVALVWNERRLSNRLERDYEALLKRFAVDYQAIMASHIELAAIRRFLSGATLRQRQFDNSQRLDRIGFRGRLQSSSYCPAPDHPNHSLLMGGVDALFEQYARDGAIELTYDTRLFLGRP